MTTNSILPLMHNPACSDEGAVLLQGNCRKHSVRDTDLVRSSPTEWFPLENADLSKLKYFADTVWFLTKDLMDLPGYLPKITPSSSAAWLAEFHLETVKTKLSIFQQFSMSWRICNFLDFCTKLEWSWNLNFLKSSTKRGYHSLHSSTHDFTGLVPSTNQAGITLGTLLQEPSAP